jgi:hypothetical protein
VAESKMALLAETKLLIIQALLIMKSTAGRNCIYSEQSDVPDNMHYAYFCSTSIYSQKLS